MTIEPAFFTPGPSATFDEVTDIAHPSLRDFLGTKRPIGTISHRHPVVDNLMDDVRDRLRRLLKIPPTHQPLLHPGGARHDFITAWMNLMQPGWKPRCAIVDSGHWANLAAADARGLHECGLIDLKEIASSHIQEYRLIRNPSVQELDGLDLVYLTTNETVNGTWRRWRDLALPVPAILDISSDIMTYPMAWDNVAVAFGSTQKNLGLAGFTVVIVREDMIGGHPTIPAPQRYRLQLERKGGLADTISVADLYSVYLTLGKIEEMGGVEAIDGIADRKANILYEAIDASEVFQGIAWMESRSRTNVTFKLSNEERHNDFLALCEREGIYDLKGHAEAFKLYGPHLRASLYVAVKIEWVQRLVEVMREFERTH